MDDEQPANVPESAQDSSLPWLAWYRRYLYFALILSAVSVVLSFTVFGGDFLGAMLDVVVAAFVLKSLKRLGDQRIKILHLAVNGATLLTAIVSMSGYGYAVPGMIQSLLSLLAVEFGALYLLGAPAIVAVAFVLISIYWLKNLYQFQSTAEGDRKTADQLAQRSDDSDTDTESSTTDG